jgi:GxxExxY protein
MEENAIGAIVIDAAVEIHRDIGPGSLEAVYKMILLDELRQRGLRTDRQASIAIAYRGHTFGEGSGRTFSSRIM